ncbi:hypothetical protein Q0M90_18775 [Rossellomorea marisflavi]
MAKEDDSLKVEVNKKKKMLRVPEHVRIDANIQLFFKGGKIIPVLRSLLRGKLK